MLISRLSVDDALASVRSSFAGLSSAEAQRRLREFGSNRIETVQREPAVLRLLREFVRFFSVILWCAAALAFLAEWLDPGHGMARIGYAVVVVILVSGIFSFWQEYRIERTLSALRRLLPQQVGVIRDSAVSLLPAEDIVVGDVIVLEAGDNVPADCRLIEGFGVRVNNATVTGESISRALNIAPATEPELLHSKNILLAGTSVVSGEGRAVVFATGGLTEFGRIAHLSQRYDAVASPLRRQLAYLSRLIAVLAICIGFAFFVVGNLIALPFWEDFIFSIGIIIAMVPEGLLPTLTLSLALVAQRMAKRNVLIRHLTSVEALGSATVICTDKTGTLTENRMRVRELFLGSEAILLPNKHPDIEVRHHDFFICAAYCHDLRTVNARRDGKFIGDAMELALIEMAADYINPSQVYPRLDEISFDSDRMRQAVVHDMPEGPVLYCKGAPEAVLPLCDRIHLDDHNLALDTAEREHIVAAQNAMTGRGLRVLAFASRPLKSNFRHDELESNLVFLGLVALEDPPRPEVPEAIKKCRDAGIKVIMVTGDHPRTAGAIAREIGLVRGERSTVITGDQLRKFSVASLQLALDEEEIIFARVAADQKMRIVETLMKKKHVVAVTGDGVNDAPALKAAHIGIAMGITGSDVAKEAADMILIDDNFASIVDAVEEGRAVFQNIRRFLTYVLVHNVAELVPFLAFVLFKIPLPLTPIQALSVDMATDSLTALGLGVERPDPRDMLQPPRPQTERLLNWSLAWRAYFFLGPIEAAVAMGAYFYVLLQAGWTYGQTLPPDSPIYLSATTACLSGIIVMQIFNVFLCRSPWRSIASIGLFDNKLIMVGVLLELLLAAMFNYTRLGNFLLDTAPIAKGVWLLLIASGVAMLVLEELRKAIVRRFFICTVAPAPKSLGGANV
jgi:sodium/potassium-transporting ATPase subunit alpha